MGWREWLGLKLSPDEFALMVIKRAKKIEDCEYKYSPNTNELIKGQGAGTGTIFLGRVYGQYCQSPSRDRIAVVDKFLSSMASTPENTIPKSYADAKPRLLPIVRDQIDLSIGNLMTSRFAAGDLAQGKPPSAMVAIPLVDQLIVGLAFDSPNAIHRLTDQRFEDWGIAASAALDDAIDNLREQTKVGGWEKLDGNVWSGNWGDAYASSRMLTPEVLHQVGLADPLVMVPSPEFIVMVDGTRPDAFDALGVIAEQAKAKSKRQLSMAVYRLKDKQWEVATIPHGQGKALRILQTVATSSAYADQKQLLEDLYSRQAVDMFVASHQLIEDSTGALKSIGIWTEGVATVLPHADLLLLQEIDENSKHVVRRVIAPFAEVLRQMPRQLQIVEGLDPPRYRTRGFPGRDVWQRLEAVAVTLPAKK